MPKRIKLSITKRQFEAIVNLTDAISGMLGTGSNFDDLGKDVKYVDKMMFENGYKRNYK